MDDSSKKTLLSTDGQTFVMMHSNLAASSVES